MPSSLFHLNVSKKIAEKYPKYDTPNFYIGTIAPDAIHVNGFAEKSIRWSAHKRAKDLEEWKLNIIHFYEEEKNNFSQDYLLGYIVHVLTDIVVDQMFYKEGIYENIIKSRANENEASKFFKNQIQVYENSQLNEEWWKDVKNKLNSAQAYEINNIHEKEIIGWKEKILKDYEMAQFEKCDYVTPKMLDECLNKVIVILKENGLLNLENL